MVGESAEEAMFRELKEEVGLGSEHVQVLGSTTEWLKYRLPDKYMRHGSVPLCIGQKQRWFMLKLVSSEDNVQLDACETPEFDRWRWVEFWRPVNEVIYFKRRVYARALHELGPHVYPQGLPPRPRWWPSRWRNAFDKDLTKAKNDRPNDN
jgi:putative (di)nucleoside polyphosphate hydrolase